MRTDTYLRQLHRFDSMIANKMLEIENLESRATNMVAPTDKENVKSSGSKDKIAVFAIMMAEESKKVDDLISRKQVIINQLDGLDNTTSYDILTKFYEFDDDLQTIADDLGYALSSVKRLKREALEEFENKYGEFYKHDTF